MALPPEDQHRGSRFPGPGMGNRNRPLLLGAIVILALLAILYGMRQTPVTGPESGTVNDTTTTTPTHNHLQQPHLQQPHRRRRRRQRHRLLPRPRERRFDDLVRP